MAGRSFGPRRRVRRRRRILSILALSIVLGIGTSLASWAGVSTSLAPVYDLATGAWEWAQVHVFTVTVSGIVVSILGLGTPFLLKRIDRRDSASQQRKARDRQVMLARVIHRCTTGIIEGPDSQKVWFELGIRRLYNPDRELAELRPATSSPALTGVSLTSIFDNAGGGILILGAPGAGKTTALLTITRDLVKRAETDQTQPIPVVLSLSSWATRRLPLSEWLVDELATAYNVPRSIGRQWLASHEFLPLLDGLDEVATPLQASCVRSINDFRRTHGLLRFVISSRKDEHASAWKLLQVEDVLEILPPTRQEIADYLAGAGPAFADVAAAAAADPTLWELLRSPLVMNVIFSIYRDKPATALRSPGSQEHRLALLFESYTKRMIERRASQFSAVHSARWLTWLARSMYERNESAFHLDRLRPDWLPGRFLQKLATWAPASLIGIIAAVAGSLGLQDADGLLFGLFFLLVFAPRRLARDGPQRRRIWQRAGLRVGVVLAFCIGIVPGIAEGDIADGLVEGLFFGLFGALLFELRREEPTEELGWMWWRAPRNGSGSSLRPLVGLGLRTELATTHSD